MRWTVPEVLYAINAAPKRAQAIVYKARPQTPTLALIGDTRLLAAAPLLVLGEEVLSPVAVAAVPTVVPEFVASTFFLLYGAGVMTVM